MHKPSGGADRRLFSLWTCAGIRSTVRKKFLLFFLIAAHLTIGSQFPPATVDMGLEQVSEHGCQAQGAAGITTASVTPKGLVVVDVLGGPSLTEPLLGLLRMVTDKPLVKVILTRYHADPICGLQVSDDLAPRSSPPVGFQDYLDSPAATGRLPSAGRLCTRESMRIHDWLGQMA